MFEPRPYLFQIETIVLIWDKFSISISYFPINQLYTYICIVYNSENIHSPTVSSVSFWDIPKNLQIIPHLLQLLHFQIIISFVINWHTFCIIYRQASLWISLRHYSDRTRFFAFSIPAIHKLKPWSPWADPYITVAGQLCFNKLPVVRVCYGYGREIKTERVVLSLSADVTWCDIGHLPLGYPLQPWQANIHQKTDSKRHHQICVRLHVDC